MQRRRPRTAALDQARFRAAALLDGKTIGTVGSATHYHADYVVPYWAASLVKIAAVDRHLFYRWPGRWGGSPLLRGGGAPREVSPPALAWFVQDPDIPNTHQQAADNGDTNPALLATDGAPKAGSDGALPTIRRVHLAPSQPVGRFAIDALITCGKAANCLVAGYRSSTLPDRLSKQQVLANPPEFLFIKSDRDRVSEAYWDCSFYPRANPAQCLPVTTSALAALLRTQAANL